MVSVGTQAQTCTRPWAMSKKAQWSENRSIARKTKYLELYEHTITVTVGRGCLRRNVPLAKRNEDQGVPSIIHDDDPRGSIDKDMHHERTRMMGVRKYLKKSYCHRIECSAANFLTAFMWRRPLNNIVLATPTHKGPEKVSNGTSTQVVPWIINNLRAKIIEREIYNGRDPRGRGRRNRERNIVTIRKQTCNQTY